MKNWLQKHLPGKNWLHVKRLHTVLGERIFDRRIWHINRHSVAGGLALGLFIAFTPTIPFQMILAAFFAVKMRVNLPLALLACWVSNPFTAVPIYMTGFKLGRFILGRLPITLVEATDTYSFWGRSLFIRASYLFAGCLLMGAAAAFIAYHGVNLLWRVKIGQAWRRRRSFRAQRKAIEKREA